MLKLHQTKLGKQNETEIELCLHSWFSLMLHSLRFSSQKDWYKMLFMTCGIKLECFSYLHTVNK